MAGEITIRIGKRRLPLRNSMGAMIIYKRATGHGIQHMDAEDLEDVCQFAYACVKASCIADKVDFDMDFDEFVCNLSPDDLNSVFASAPEVQKKTTVKV